MRLWNSLSDFSIQCVCVALPYRLPEVMNYLSAGFAFWQINSTQFRSKVLAQIPDINIIEIEMAQKSIFLCLKAIKQFGFIHFIFEI